jgi:hypothetical protein
MEEVRRGLLVYCPARGVPALRPFDLGEPT